MRKTSRTLAFSMVLAAGCATVGGPEKAANQQRAEEQIIDFDLACRDRRVTLNHQANSSVSVHPPYIEVCRGRTITVHIVPPVNPQQNASRSESKPGNPSPNTWLNQASGDGNTILLVVPNDAPVDSTYQYALEIEGIGSIDPGIRIIQ